MTAIESACFLLLPHLPDLRPPASQQSPKQKSLGHRSLGNVGRASKSLGAVLFCFTLRPIRFNFTADISVQSSSVSSLLLTSLFLCTCDWLLIIHCCAVIITDTPIIVGSGRCGGGRCLVILSPFPLPLSGGCLCCLWKRKESISPLVHCYADLGCGVRWRRFRWCSVFLLSSVLPFSFLLLFLLQ